MELITNINKLTGKTILNVIENPDGDGGIGVVFNDKSYGLLTIKYCGGDPYIDLSEKVENYIKRDMGIITKEEYNRLENARRIKSNELVETREREQLEFLTKKYKND